MFALNGVQGVKETDFTLGTCGGDKAMDLDLINQAVLYVFAKAEYRGEDSKVVASTLVSLADYATGKYGNKEFWKTFKARVRSVAEDIQEGKRLFTVATIVDIDTDGESLLATCIYYGPPLDEGLWWREEDHTFTFRFSEKGKITDNDSRLCRELFGYDSVIVEDLSEEEEKEGTAQSAEDWEASTFVSYIADNKEKYRFSLIYTTDDPQNGSVSPESIFSLSSEEEEEK